MAAAIQRPYRMIRRSEPWELDEPGLNDNGQPIVHNIAQMLRCIHPGSVQLPSHPVLAEDEPTVAELARWLEERQLHELEISEWLGPGATCSDSAASGLSSDNYAKCGASLDLGGLRASSPKDYTTAPRGHDTILSDAESLANVTDATLRDAFVSLEKHSLFPKQLPTLPLFSPWATDLDGARRNQQPRQYRPLLSEGSMPSLQHPNPLTMSFNDLDGKLGTSLLDTLVDTDSALEMGMFDASINFNLDFASLVN